MNQDQPKISEFTLVHGELDMRTVELVKRFSQALTDKLLHAQRKHGYSDNWAQPGWADECREKLMLSISKGDPVDVANYAAFLWFHGEPTSVQPPLEFERKKPKDTEGGGLD